MKFFRIAVLLVATGSCSSDRPNAPQPLRGTIELISGGSQNGTSGAPLPEPIVITIVDDKGAPVAGVPVEWFTNDSGVIEPLSPVSDSLGRSVAQWTLGINGGVHIAMARAQGFPPLTITARTPRVGPLPSDDIRPLHLSTYDGSGQTAHPDYVRIPGEWPHAVRDYLAITPYPNANFAYENPSLYESPDLISWDAPPGVTNPLAQSADGYLSDPDIVFDPTRRELFLYYREVVNDNAIFMIRSSDATVWSAPTLVAHAQNHDIVSPSVVRRGPDDWMMWSVNTHEGCGAESSSLELRRSKDGVQWSRPVRVSMSPSELQPWHIDVQWMEGLGEYWAVFNAKPPFSCTTTELYLATSPDGVRWTTLPTPILQAGAIPEFSDIVYRSTFAYDQQNDAVTFWYSGARAAGNAFVWSSAVQKRNRYDVIVQASEPRDSHPTSVRWPSAVLTDPP